MNWNWNWNACIFIFFLATHPQVKSASTWLQVTNCTISCLSVFTDPPCRESLTRLHCFTLHPSLFTLSWCPMVIRKLKMLTVQLACLVGTVANMYDVVMTHYRPSCINGCLEWSDAARSLPPLPNGTQLKQSDIDAFFVDGMAGSMKAQSDCAMPGARAGMHEKDCGLNCHDEVYVHLRLVRRTVVLLQGSSTFKQTAILIHKTPLSLLPFL